ncbi:hypothetical protein CLIB1444_24S00738 [[Candida] jaroonii]|uniref:Uncharacterized protein n=1 Tax=[Candida] jaroonii TaxID=467808 RepID=A0ACA9YFZ2_9ASCO|nr:hypothetical protein CLIB1444_24S00738 [[Candida] jaroonii]
MSDIDSEYSDSDQAFDTAHEIRPAKSSDFRSPGGRNHEKLAELFGIDEEDEVIFLSLLCLCDPKTQPSESNDYVLSIQYLTEVFIGIVYLETLNKIEGQEDDDFVISITSVKFKMSLQIYQILFDILCKLGVADDEGLRSLNSGINLSMWDDGIEWWGPAEELYNDHFNLRTSYLMCCILFNALNFLFVENGICNLATNPYTPFFTRFWNYYTDLLSKELDIDHFLEYSGKDTPPGLVEMLKGASIVRYMLAYILNQSQGPSNPNYIIDLTEKSLLDVYDPVVRDNVNGGAVTRDIHYYEFIHHIMNLGEKPSEGRMFYNDHPPFDGYDEDLRYILDYESAEELSDVEDEVSSFKNLQNYLRSAVEEFIGGKDFEDRTPQERIETSMGPNLMLNDSFRKSVLPQLRSIIHDVNSLSTDDVEGLLTFDHLPFESIMTSSRYKDDPKDHVIRIAKVMFLSEVFLLSDHYLDDLISYIFEEADERFYTPLVEQNAIVPVYSIKNLDVLLVKCPETIKAILVELFFSPSRRGMLVFNLCHEINLSYKYIDFICQILVGFPLNPEYGFSRKGKTLEFTDFEKGMMFNHFIESCALFLKASEGIENDEGFEFTLSTTVCHKFVHLICLLIAKVIQEGIFESKDGAEALGSIHVIIGFLFSWISKVPLARTLYFQVLESFKANMVDPIKVHMDEGKYPDVDPKLANICVNVVHTYKKSQLITRGDYEEAKEFEGDAGAITEFIENFPQIVDSNSWQILKEIGKRPPALPKEEPLHVHRVFKGPLEVSKKSIKKKYK